MTRKSLSKFFTVQTLYNLSTLIYVFLSHKIIVFLLHTYIRYKKNERAFSLTKKQTKLTALENVVRKYRVSVSLKEKSLTDSFPTYGKWNCT